MASDLIGRDALMSMHYDMKYTEVKGEVFVRLEDVVNWIKSIPTVDAAPVVQGEWKACEDDWNYETTYECLICGFGIKTEQGSKFDWNFCPNCGADMRGNCNE